MKKLIFMMCVMLITLKGWAYGQEEVKTPIMVAIYDSESATLNFVYDIEKTEGTVETGITVSCGPFSFTVPQGVDGYTYDDYGWYFPITSQYGTNQSWTFLPIKKVVFHPSFANARPERIRGWFERLSTLEEIVGIQYLNTSMTIDMRGLFDGCTSLTNLDVSHFDTSNVTDMRYLFADCWNLTAVDISNFDTGNVTNMSGMFDGCRSLTSLDVSKFNTSNVTNMRGMFDGCSGLTSLDVSKFNTSNVTNMRGMFDGCSGLTSLDVSKFNTSNVTDMRYMFSDCSNLTNLDVSKFNTGNVTDMGRMFFGCSGISVLDVNNFNTSNVTDMEYMFYDCSGLTSLDVCNFNTSNVTTMEYMFCGCRGLTSLDVSKFNTSNVTNMSSMFRHCESLSSLDLSSFNTGKVTDMSYMFSMHNFPPLETKSSLANINLTSFNTANVTDMKEMFYGCSSLPNLDVSNLNTRNVTDMSSMFAECSGLTSLDVCNFDTKSAPNMINMFNGCSNLETIYCNDSWITGTTYWGNMFTACNSIKGGHGDTYSAEKVSSAYAHPESGGYFTGKRTTFSTVTIGESVQYWSSFYTDTRNVRADNSTTVYTANLSSDGTELTLNEVADKIVPSGQAVLMKSTVKEPMLVTASSEGTGDYTTNSLLGTQVDIPTSSIEGTVYTLANSTEFGFYKYTGTTLKGGKAFLVVPGGALARITIAGLDDDATGIERIGTDESQAPCYDLQGRRVSQPQKGIYIINGKKVVK